MSPTEVTHRIHVAAPADDVYRVIADVSRWPLYFPPTVRAERVAGDDHEERVRLWALANGELRTWESKRWLDPINRRVSFGQEKPTDPVAELGGRWSVEQHGDEACTVVLDHHYRAVDDEPTALERIARAVETNSTAELEHLRLAAERGEQERELLLEFSDTEVITGTLDDIYDFIYDAARWPERIPHVQRVELSEHTSGLQVMEMDTRSPDGSVHTTVSGRVCTPGRIVYKQSLLPPVLQSHNGEWLFEQGEDETITVTSWHQVILDPDAIAALPEPPASLEAARAAVRHSLGTNSRTTLARAQEFLTAN